jgi:hypothetical protein
MASIKLTDFMFVVENDKVVIKQHDKSMGMFERLTETPITDLLQVKGDYTVKTYRTVVIPNYIIETLQAYLNTIVKEG